MERVRLEQFKRELNGRETTILVALNPFGPPNSFRDGLSSSARDKNSQSSTRLQASQSNHLALAFIE
jgi:hypothetical protein